MSTPAPRPATPSRPAVTPRRHRATRLRAVLALALVAALTLGLAACGGKLTAITGTKSPQSEERIGQRLSFGASTETTDSLVFLGDTQDFGPNGVGFGSLLTSVTPRDLVLIAGDLVNDQQEQKQWQAFAAQFPPNVSLSKQVAVVPGNHTPDPPAANLFAKHSPSVITMAHTEILLLDSNLLGSLDGAQIKQNQHFFEQALALRGNRSLILVMHHPIFVLTNNPKNVVRASTMMKNYGRYFKQATLILCGHEHLYARYTDPATGIIQVMGNASYKGYPPRNPKRPGLNSLYTGGLVVTRISVSSKTLELTTFDGQGKQIDSFTR